MEELIADRICGLAGPEINSKDLAKDATRILKRHPANPIMHVKDYPGVAQLYNPSPVQFGDETILLPMPREGAYAKESAVRDEKSPEPGEAEPAVKGVLS